MVALAASTNPASAHHRDQTTLFSDERWVTSRFCKRNIMRSPELEVVRVRERG
ncbi:hypothetical protein [Streptomyces sp. NPDC002889]|uniref:hypothetical protein n=1 Tax=Streptomyces sp. NPDC002889 TaxID=3364669 RepID=UPI0036B50578